MYKTLAPGAIAHNCFLGEAAPVAAKAGFEGLWLDLPLEAAPDAGESREILARYGLKAAGFTLPVEFRKGPELYEEGLAVLAKYASYAQAIGMERCITWIFPFSDTMDYGRNFAFHRQRLAGVAAILREHGIRLGLEFIGPKTMREGHRFEFAHTCDQMMELCNAVGTGNVGLLLDVFHWDLAGHGTADFRRIPDASWVVHAHIMDAPAGRTPEEQLDQERCLPGATGVLRTAEFFQGLQSLGYDGPVQPEPFTPSLGDLPFEEAAARVKAALDSVWPV